MDKISKTVAFFKTTFVVFFANYPTLSQDEIHDASEECIKKLQSEFGLSVLCCFNTIEWTLLNKLLTKSDLKNYFEARSKLKYQFYKLVQILKDKTVDGLEKKLFVSSFSLQEIREFFIPNFLEYEAIEIEHYLYLKDFLDKILTQQVDCYKIKKHPHSWTCYKNPSSSHYISPVKILYGSEAKEVVSKTNLYLHGLLPVEKQEEIIENLKPDTIFFYIPVLQYSENIAF